MGDALRGRAGARKVRRNAAAGAARFDSTQQGRAQRSGHDADWKRVYFSQCWTAQDVGLVCQLASGACVTERAVSLSGA